MKYRPFPVLVLLVLIACKPSVQAMPIVPSAGSEKGMISRGSAPEAPVPSYEERQVRERTPKGVSETYFLCLRKAGYAAVASASCISEEIVQQDKRLNGVYKKLLGALTGKAKNSLLEAQRSWIQLSARDEELEENIFDHEIIMNVQSHQNKLFRICERANTLDAYLAAVE